MRVVYTYFSGISVSTYVISGIPRVSRLAIVTIVVYISGYNIYIALLL